MKRILLILLIGAVGSAFASNNAKHQHGRQAQASPPIAADNQDAQVQVNGMICGFCATGIEKQFDNTKKVKAVHVNLKNGWVSVDFVDGQKLTEAEIRQAIEDAGYEPGEVKIKGS